VVSKVVMSVCALLIAGTLTGIVNASLSPDPENDLGDILASLQRTVSAIAAHEGECTVTWEVPTLPSGATVGLYIRECDATACAEDADMTVEIMPELHPWAWDGQPINWTRVEELDRVITCFEARSGDELALSCRWVLVDDSDELLMFVG